MIQTRQRLEGVFILFKGVEKIYSKDVQTMTPDQQNACQRLLISEEEVAAMPAMDYQARKKQRRAQRGPRRYHSSSTEFLPGLEAEVERLWSALDPYIEGKCNRTPPALCSSIHDSEEES